MRIWLIGADQAGTSALRELRKNPEIEVIITDTIERPRAVVERVIDGVDMVETVTPVNINLLARRIRPDLILMDGGAAQRALTRVTGGLAFAEAMLNEIKAASDYPCVVL